MVVASRTLHTSRGCRRCLAGIIVAHIMKVSISLLSNTQHFLCKFSFFTSLFSKIFPSLLFRSLFFNVTLFNHLHIYVLMRTVIPRMSITHLEIIGLYYEIAHLTQQASRNVPQHIKFVMVNCNIHIVGFVRALVKSVFPPINFD